MQESNFYELTYIIKPTLEEDQVKATVEKVNSMLTENGVTIEEVDEWGLKELAYDIDKVRNGYFVNMYFDAPGEAIGLLERNMRLDDNIFRYLVLKYDAKMRRHRELVKKGEAPVIFPQDPDQN